MAFKPSKRRHRPESNVELDITPIMNLMIVLVPFLLLAAVFSKTAILNLYLPSAEDTSSSEEQIEDESLSLTVAITANGFLIGGIEDKKIPDIKLKNNEYDYSKLSIELKKVKDMYPTNENIVLLIEPDIEYDVIVHTMDATREIKQGEKTIALFPAVSLADSIIVTEEEDGQQAVE